MSAAYRPPPGALAAPRSCWRASLRTPTAASHSFFDPPLNTWLFRRRFAVTARTLFITDSFQYPLWSFFWHKRAETSRPDMTNVRESARRNSVEEFIRGALIYTRHEARWRAGTFACLSILMFNFSPASQLPCELRLLFLEINWFDDDETPSPRAWCLQSACKWENSSRDDAVAITCNLWLAACVFRVQCKHWDANGWIHELRLIE